LCAAFAAGIALSYPLWLSSRSFPLAPVASWIPSFPFPLDHALVAVLLGSLLVGAIVESVVPLLVALAGLTILGAQDQSRWQPWVYQYAIMLVVLAHPAGGARACSREMLACRAIVSGLWFWSGVQKLNASFLESGLTAIVPSSDLPEAVRSLLVRAGIVVPALEIAIGLGFLWARTRRAAAFAAIAMHASILGLLGPLGDSWNSVVWPWNLAMIVFAWVLARGSEDARTTLGLGARGRDRRAAAVHALAVVAFWLLPALSFVDAWDAYLSASLYSKNIRQAAFKVAPEAGARMPSDLRARIDEDGLLWLMDWSLDELNVPAYPEERVFTRVAAALCEHSRTDGDLVMIVAHRPPVLGGERGTSTYRCAEVVAPSSGR
jgi:hypothetical protein